jgi:hypothetical protein
MIEFQLEEIVTLNGREIDVIDIYERPLVPRTVKRAQGGGGVYFDGKGRVIDLIIQPGSSDAQWLESLSRQNQYQLEFESIQLSSLRKKIGKRGYIAKRAHDTWHLEFPDWEISQ